MATEKRQFTLRTQEETFLKIQELAKRDHRSIAMEFEYIVSQYIKNYEEKNGIIYSSINEPLTTIAASKQGDRTENLPEHILKQIEDSKEAYRKEFRDKRD